MPNVSIYIKNHIWSRLLRQYKGDDLEARRAIKRLVEAQYGKSTQPTA